MCSVPLADVAKMKFEVSTLSAEATSAEAAIVSAELLVSVMLAMHAAKLLLPAAVAVANALASALAETKLLYPTVPLIGAFLILVIALALPIVSSLLAAVYQLVGDSKLLPITLSIFLSQAAMLITAPLVLNENHGAPGAWAAGDAGSDAEGGGGKTESDTEAKTKTNNVKDAFGDDAIANEQAKLAKRITSANYARTTLHLVAAVTNQQLRRLQMSRHPSRTHPHRSHRPHAPPPPTPDRPHRSHRPGVRCRLFGDQRVRLARRDPFDSRHAPPTRRNSHHQHHLAISRHAARWH